MARNLQNLAVGAIFSLPEHTGSGTATRWVEFMVLEHGEHHTQVIRRNTHSQIQWDSVTNTNSYAGSNADTWCTNYLNNTGGVNGLPAWVRAHVPNVSIPIRDIGATANTNINRSVFFPSRRELFGNGDDGTRIERFSSNANRVARNDSGTARAYWTRTPINGTLTARNAWRVNADGTGSNVVQFTPIGVTDARPMFPLPANITIGSNNRLIDNITPGKAGTITVARNHTALGNNQILAGAPVTISWGAATPGAGSNQNQVTYLLQRSWNGGAWTRVVEGISGLTHTIQAGVPAGTNTARFRVIASDQHTNSIFNRESGNFTVITNRAPAAPASISVTTAPFERGGPVRVTWPAAVHPDGRAMTYRLERSADGGTTWVQVLAATTALNWSGTVGMAWDTMRFRVRATDVFDATSGWRTSQTFALRDQVSITVEQDSTSDIRNGMTFTDDAARRVVFRVANNRDSAMTQQYTVSLAHNDRRIQNGQMAIAGGLFTLELSRTQWQQILNGPQTYTLTVTDSQGNAGSGTIAFTKNITRAILQSDPVFVDIDDGAPITRFQMKIAGNLRLNEGATLLVEVTNNVRDNTPAWETVLPGQLDGTLQPIANKIVQNGNYFAFRVTADVGSSTGPCWIDLISGVAGMSQTLVLGQESGQMRGKVDAIDQRVTTLEQRPAGGLNVPDFIALESEIDITGRPPGTSWKIANCDVTAPGRTGLAWVNNAGALAIFVDPVGIDGVSITLDSNGNLQLDPAWLTAQLAGLGIRIDNINSELVATAAALNPS